MNEAKGHCDFHYGFNAFCNECNKAYVALTASAYEAQDNARRSAPQQAQVLSAEHGLEPDWHLRDRVYQSWVLVHGRGTWTHQNESACGEELESLACRFGLRRETAAPAQPPGAEKPKCCEPLGMHPMVDGVCIYCKRTNEQMRADGLKILEAPKPAVTKRRGFTAPEPSKPLHSGLPAGEQLKAFTAAVHEHLLPRLPEKLKVVTDVVHGGRFALWVIDERNRELYEEEFGYVPMPVHLEGCAINIASALMSRLARPASELKRGRE